MSFIVQRNHEVPPGVVRPGSSGAALSHPLAKIRLWNAISKGHRRYITNFDCADDMAGAGGKTPRTSGRKTRRSPKRFCNRGTYTNCGSSSNPGKLRENFPVTYSRPIFPTQFGLLRGTVQRPVFLPTLIIHSISVQIIFRRGTFVGISLDIFAGKPVGQPTRCLYVAE